MEMGQPETPADQATVAEQAFDLSRRGIGDEIEILRLAPEKKVADAAADQVGFEAVVPEAIERSQGIGAEHACGRWGAGPAELRPAGLIS